MTENQREMPNLRFGAALCLAAALLVSVRARAQTTGEGSRPGTPAVEAEATQPDAPPDSSPSLGGQPVPLQDSATAPQPSGTVAATAQPQGWHSPSTARHDGEPASQRRADVHFHDGLYFRFGIGIGYARSDVTGDFDQTVDISGLALPLEVAIGGTPSPGLVIGIGIYGASIPSANVAVDDRDTDSETTQVFSSIGPFVDYYFSPDRGFHTQAGFAFAATLLNQQFEDGQLRRTATGWAAMLGMGWETWVGEQWGLGILARVQYARLHAGEVTAEADGYEETAEVDETFATIVPALLLTATLH